MTAVAGAPLTVKVCAPSSRTCAVAGEILAAACNSYGAATKTVKPPIADRWPEAPVGIPGGAQSIFRPELFGRLERFRQQPSPLRASRRSLAFSQCHYAASHGRSHYLVRQTQLFLQTVSNCRRQHVIPNDVVQTH